MGRVHPDDRERVEAARRYSGTRDGKSRWVAAFSTALMEGGTFAGRIGTITDITDAKKHFPDGR